MAAGIETIVQSTVVGLGFELVDFERTARGLLRVFIDKPAGITVDDCADVSNHLTRVFAVEGIEFDRLEVSSPGLDRPLKTLADFARFQGEVAKVKLNIMVDGRKKFDGVIGAVEDESVVFQIVDEVSKDSGVAAGGKPLPKSSRAVGKGKSPVAAPEKKLIRVPLGNIDKARLIPAI